MLETERALSPCCCANDVCSQPLVIFAGAPITLRVLLVRTEDRFLIDMSSS